MSHHRHRRVVSAFDAATLGMYISVIRSLGGKYYSHSYRSTPPSSISPSAAGLASSVSYPNIFIPHFSLPLCYHVARMFTFTFFRPLVALITVIMKISKYGTVSDTLQIWLN